MNTLRSQYFEKLTELWGQALQTHDREVRDSILNLSRQYEQLATLEAIAEAREKATQLRTRAAEFQNDLARDMLLGLAIRFEQLAAVWDAWLAARESRRKTIPVSTR